MAAQMWTDSRNLQGKLNIVPREEYLNMYHQHMAVAVQSLKDNNYLLDMVQLPLTMIQQGNSNVLDITQLVQTSLLHHNNIQQYRIDNL